MSRLHNFSSVPHSWSTNLPTGPGTINSLGIKTIKQVININTAFRENYNTASATEYIVKLPFPINNIISMSLYDYNIPANNYSISDFYHNNSFIIYRDISGTPIPHIVDISDGMYTLSNLNTLLTEINSKIQSHTSFADIQITMDKRSLKSTFSSTTGTPFKLDFSYKSLEKYKNCSSTVKINNIAYNDQLTLGWRLGFRGDYIKKINSQVKSAQYPSTLTSNSYSRCMITNTKDINDISFNYGFDISQNTYTSEGLVNLTSENNMFLVVNDFKNNHNNVYINGYREDSQLTSNILAKLKDNREYGIKPIPRIYFGPTKIEKLGISIIDAYGRVYNNNYGDYSIELLVESIYDGK